jgi:hypothetical protein
MVKVSQSFLTYSMKVNHIFPVTAGGLSESRVAKRVWRVRVDRLEAQSLRDDQAYTHAAKNRMEPKKATILVDLIRNISCV